MCHLHLEHAPFGGCYTLGASHDPTILASCWEGWMTSIHDGCEGYSATEASDAYTHLSATSTPPE